MKETTSKQTKKNLKQGLNYSLDSDYLDSDGYLTENADNFIKDFLDLYKDDPEFILSSLFICMDAIYDFAVTDEELLEYANKKIKGHSSRDLEILKKIISEDIAYNEYSDLINKFVSINDDKYEFSGWDHVHTLNILPYLLLRSTGGESLYEISCGDGDFLTESCIFLRDCDCYQEKDALQRFGSVNGIETDKNKILLARMRLTILNKGEIDINIKSGNPLDSPEPLYDTAYVHPPIGQHQLFKNKTYRSLLYPDITFDNPFYEQWVYVDRMLASLRDDGFYNGVALLHGKSLVQTKDNVYLQRLLEDGLIEGILEVHDKEIVDSFGSIAYYVIFSRGNRTVDLATSYYDVLYDHSLTDSDDYPLAFFLFEPNDHPDEINVFTINEMKQLNSWIPSRIQTSDKKKHLSNSVLLKDSAEVIQATQYTASDFEISDTKTDYKILTPTDIDNGQIKWDELKYVNINKTLFDKYVLRKDDLIMTNKTTKIKTAVVDISPEEKVIVTGGMLIIRPNVNKLNPTYLKMYLESSDGDTALRTSQTGSSVINLSPILVENIEIPMIEIEKQNKKADSYNSKLASINAYRENIKKLEQDMRYIFDEEDD